MSDTRSMLSWARTHRPTAMRSLLAAIATALAMLALSGQPQPATAAGETVDVTVTILTYQEIECPDGELVPCPGDYYAKVAIGPHDFEPTPQGPDQTGLFSPYWKVTKTVDRSLGSIPVKIELHDDDNIEEINNDDRVDIAPGDDELTLQLDLDTGTWTGDNGVNQTWSTGSGDDSARILFDISIGDGDFDDDGIPDAVERFGVREVETGNVVADLSNFGSVNPQAADPCRKTILMEIDFLSGAADGHTHFPKNGALSEVQNAFSVSDVPGSSSGCPYAGFGTSGVQLLIERSNSIPEKPVFTLNDLDSTRNDRANFHPARRPYFHYVVFAHNQAAGSSSSGLCCRDGKDFIVTLGSWQRLCVGAGPDGASNTTRVDDDQPDGAGNITNGADRQCDTTANSTAPADDIQLLPVGDQSSDQQGTARDQASTIMHELGHSLGLEHRGRDDVNNTPNYMSVMSYHFQAGIRLAAGGSVIDYSRDALPTLNEASLDENDGIGGPAPFNTFWFDRTGTQQMAGAAGAIDWDRDGTIEASVNVDVNRDSMCIGPGADGNIDTPRLGDDFISNGFIVNGTDDACNTSTPTPDDVQMAASSGFNGADLNRICVGPGTNEKIDTAKSGDDVAFTNRIVNGPNLICDTTATGNDIQVVPVGKSEPRIHPGWDDWANLRYRGVVAAASAGAGAGHTGDLTYESFVASQTALTALLDPDLEAKKSVDKADATPGDKLTYTVTAKNVGTGDARSVKVTDTLPNGTVEERTPQTIYYGESATETFTYTVPCGTADGTVLTNRVALGAKNLESQPEANTANNSASASTTVHAPVMTLAKTATASVNAGEAITYRLTYANTGSGDAASVVVTDTLPADVYYSVALDLGSGPKPDSVTLNADGTRTLKWNVGAVAKASGPSTIEFTARPTLLALGGTVYTNNASLTFTDANGCTYPPVNASAATTITVVPPSRDPLTVGYWRNHPEQWTSETLARIQATDQRYDGADGTLPDGKLSVAELTFALAPAAAARVILAQQLLATYINLAERRINAGTTISSKTANRLGLMNVRAAALYSIATLALPEAQNRNRYADATQVLDEINRNKSEIYG